MHPTESHMSSKGDKGVQVTNVPHLHKDSEEDDHYGGGDEEPLLGESSIRKTREKQIAPLRPP